MKPLGKHLILELHGCPPANLDNPDLISRVLVQAAEDSGATIINPFFHQFSPQGVSGVVVVAESHFSIHTWPEYGYAAVDMFTCGDTVDMDLAVDLITVGLGAGEVQRLDVDRGMVNQLMTQTPGDQPPAGPTKYWSLNHA